MVHFPPLPSLAYEFSERYFGMSQSGFPHSEIPGSKTACVSPRLIAACHVLHRLLAPRHSPYALSSLTKCSLHLTACDVVKKLPIAEYSVVKKPFALSAKTCWCLTRSTFALRATGGQPSLGLPTVATLVGKRCEGWWRIPGSNR